MRVAIFEAVPIANQPPDRSPAYRNLTPLVLRRKLWLFGIMNQAKMVQILGFLAEWALKFRLPVGGLIRATVFQEFCGGESLQKSLPKIAELQRSGIGSIPDYSVEGLNSEELMDETLVELQDALTFTARHPETPLFVFKVTGLIHSNLLEASGRNELNDPTQIQAFHRGKERVMNLLRRAADLQCPIMIDAEESWLQDPIDQIALEASAEFNRSKAIVIQTLQMYRHDRLEYLMQCLKHAQENGYIPGLR